MANRKKLPGLLYDKTTGWWFSNVKDPVRKCGRAKHMWSKDREEAQRQYNAAIEKIVAEHSVNEPVVPAVEDAVYWSLIEMAAHYYDRKKADGCSALFLASIKRHLKRFLDWLQAQGFDVCQKGAEALSSALLAAYRQSLADDASIGVKTANHYVDHVRMLLLWGSKMHGICHPPIGAIQQFPARRNTKSGHGRRYDRTPFSWDEIAKLLSAADVTEIALVMLGLNCGFGNSDVGTLRLADVDLEAGTVSHPRPKTGVERDFTLWPETVEVLKAYLAHHRGRPRGEEATDLFFVTRKGHPLCWQELKPDGKVRRSDAVKCRFERLCKAAGVERKYGVGFYILRHTYATLIGSSSKDFREVQAALGQLTLKQQEIYRHDRMIKAKSAHKRLREEMCGTAIPRILHDKLGGALAPGKAFSQAPSPEERSQTGASQLMAAIS